MALKSITALAGSYVESSSLEIQRPIEAIKETVVRKVKWLNETVRILVNSSKWAFNRSAFLTG